ncbi:MULTISPECIES: hypothetical protein [Flavobacteriaceae]|uniref:hypothetical protein n=1 Tax=Flavobacteriaceae TaxID=49546 RepID=UPI001492A032|nr:MULTISPECIES: hypothetical protein [Allomuricauda]MDC6365224.1 hypothetical protein [Muricauda sp. AC10]
MALIVTAENQIQRLNGILGKVEKLQQLPLSQLTIPAHERSWCIVEVLEHLNIAYQLYVDKIDHALGHLPSTNSDSSEFKVRAWQRMVIEMQRPKNGERKWKIKTMKRFEPLLDTKNLDEEQVNAIFLNFYALYGHLKDAIIQSRGKDVKEIKITSAIGPIVKFYLPESFEFLLCHLERHMVQIEEILA